MATSKLMILLLLGFTTLSGTVVDWGKNQQVTPRDSKQISVETNLSKVLEDDEDGIRQLFLLGDEAVSPLIKYLSGPRSPRTTTSVLRKLGKRFVG